MTKSLKASLRKGIVSIVMMTTIFSLSGIAALIPVAQAATIVDGDVIRNPSAAGDAQFDVYIVKLMGANKYKRLVLNPAVFASYGHLKWENVKTVTSAEMNEYKTSAMVRVETDPKVLALAPNGDVGSKSWLNVSAETYNAAGGTWDQVYTINAVDGANYAAAADLTTSAQVVTFLTTGALPGVVTPTPTPVAGAVTVSLSADTSASGTIVQGQAIAPLASFTISNGASAETKVTSLSAKRLGVSADTTLTKVYLYEGETRLTDDASVSSGVIFWNNTAGLFSVPANSSRTVTVKSNIQATAAGQTVGVGIESAASVTVSVGTVGGTFPIYGNMMSIASATLANFDLAIAVTPGANTSLDPQEGFTAWQNTVSVGTRAVYLKSMNFRVIGSIEQTSLKNFKLLVNGAQVGSTVASMDASGYVLFNLSAAPKKLEAGSPVFKVVLDVIGGSNRNFQVSLRNAADVSVTDSDYGSNILARGNGSATDGVYAEHINGLQTISVGTLTITKKSTSLSGNVTLGATGVALATYEMKALGEKMKVENLRVYIDSSDANTAQTFRNGALFVDGAQVGSSTSIYELNNATAAYSEISLGSSVVVEPGIIKTLEIRADIYDNEGTTNSVSTGDTLTAYVDAGSTNVQRMTSAGFVSVPTTDQAGNTLTVATGSLTLAKDQAYGSQSIVVPATAYKIGQWTLSGASTEDVNLDTIQVDLTFANAFAAADLTNIYVVYGTKTAALKAASSAVSGANTWSISESLVKNTSMTFAFYGDIATAATDGGTDDTVIPSLKVSGTTASSATAVNTGTVLAGQTITAVSAGTLTVSLDNGTPQAAIAVAGSTPSDGALKVKLTSTNEDMYVKDLKFYTDNTLDDAVIASATLWSATSSSGTYTQVGIAKTWDANSTVPGFVRWTLSGVDRIKVAKNGSVYLLVKPTYVASSEATVTMQTPRLFLGDLQAEGSSTLIAQSATPNYVNDAGIIVQALTSATYATSTETTSGAQTAAATSIVTANGIVFFPGEIIFVNEATASWNYATEELMVVLEDDGINLTVQRGAFGTTAQAYTTGKAIFRLNNANTANTNGVIGNAVVVAKDKVVLSVATDTPQGATTGGSQRVIFKFNAAAANNAEDVGENKVVMTSVDLTTTKSGLTVNNVALYPSEFDQNTTYKTTCVALSASKWRCTFDTDGATNEIVENSARVYVVRADVGSGAGTSNTLDVSIASLGSAASVGTVTAGDVVWTDATTSISWVNQAGASYIQPATPMTLGANSGTVDATDPAVSSITVNGTADNKWTAADTVVVIFSERMDPAQFVTTGGAGTLVPDGTYSVTAIPASTGYLTRTAAAASLAAIPGLFATGMIVGGNTSAPVSQAAAIVKLMLSTDGTTLTIYVVTAGADDASAVAESYASSTPSAATLKDVNGETLATTAVTPSGTGF